MAQSGAGLLLLGSCGGGQSGTESGGSIICEEGKPRSVEPEETPPFFDRSLNDLATTLFVSELPGLWLATGTRPQLSLELGTASARLLSTVSDGALCGAVVEVDATVRSSDGVLDAQVRALVGMREEGELVLTASLPALPSTHVGRALWLPDEHHAYGWLQGLRLGPYYGAVPADGSPSLQMRYPLDTSPLDVAAVIYDSRRVLGVWAPNGSSPVSGPPYPYTPDPLLASACAGAEQSEDDGRGPFTPYPSPDAALAGVVGTWARCRDPLPSSHAGLQILADGSWRDFTLEGGELVARHGFQHEGFLEVHAAGSSDDTSGAYWLNLLPFGRRADSDVTSSNDGSTLAGEPALVFLSDFEEWPAAVYRRTPLPVRTAAPEYADGERAGAPACAHTEQSIIPTREESASLLSGDFVLCSGALSSGATRLRFGPASVELQREDGSIVSRASYEFNAMNAGLSLSLTGEGTRFGWNILASRKPLKLWIEDSNSTFSTSRAVFSALP